MKHLSACLLTLLVGCGGGGGGGSSAPATTTPIIIPPVQVISTGNLYDPIKADEQIQYSIVAITATLDSNNQVLIQSIGATQQPQTWQYSTTTCGTKTYFVETAFEGLLSSIQPIPPKMAASLLDTISISTTGIQYIGEGGNVDGFSTPSEPEITLNPVVGETIDTYAIITGVPCGDTLVANPSFHTHYTTVEHLTNWNSYSDVWHTRLIEFNGNNIGAVYEYYFAYGIGEVGISYVDSYDSTTGIWSGYQAIALNFKQY